MYCTPSYCPLFMIGLFILVTVLTFLLCTVPKWIYELESIFMLRRRLINILWRLSLNRVFSLLLQYLPMLQASPTFTAFCMRFSNLPALLTSSPQHLSIRVSSYSHLTSPSKPRTLTRSLIACGHHFGHLTLLCCARLRYKLVSGNIPTLYSLNLKLRKIWKL